MTFLKQLVNNVVEDNCLRSAAAVAFYAALSLPALLVLVIWIGSVVVDPEMVRERLQTEVADLIGSDGARQVMDLLAGATQGEDGTLGKIIGIAALVIGATGIVGQLQMALNETWHVQPDPSRNVVFAFLLRRLVSLAMVAAFAFLLLVSLVLSTLITAASEQAARWLPGAVTANAVTLLNGIASLAVFTLLFAAMFKVLPDAKIRMRDMWVGAAVTTLLMLLGKYVLGAYLGSKNMESAYGAAGSLVLVMAWIYYSAVILLVGAEFTQLWAERRGRRIVPANGAVRVEVTTRTLDGPRGEKVTS